MSIDTDSRRPISQQIRDDNHVMVAAVRNALAGIAYDGWTHHELSANALNGMTCDPLDWRSHLPTTVIRLWRRMSGRERAIAFLCANVVMQTREQV